MGKCDQDCQCGRHQRVSRPGTGVKISAAKKGISTLEMTEAIRQKISDGNKGKVRSEETRQRMSAVQRRRSGRDSYINKGGYVVLVAQDHHPLMTSTQTEIFEHRKMLFDTIGPGPHLCHWGCGKSLDWGGHGLIPDHVNGDRSDNRIENLVPSCTSCNNKRARAGNPSDWRIDG